MKRHYTYKHVSENLETLSLTCPKLSLEGYLERRSLKRRAPDQSSVLDELGERMCWKYTSGREYGRNDGDASMQIENEKGERLEERE